MRRCTASKMTTGRFEHCRHWEWKSLSYKLLRDAPIPAHIRLGRRGSGVQIAPPRPITLNFSVVCGVRFLIDRGICVHLCALRTGFYWVGPGWWILVTRHGGNNHKVAALQVHPSLARRLSRVVYQRGVGSTLAVTGTRRQRRRPYKQEHHRPRRPRHAVPVIPRADGSEAPGSRRDRRAPVPCRC